MEPSEDYAPLWNRIRKKTHISNAVIAFMQNNIDATYEDLLNYLETKVVPQKGMTAFTEEDLLYEAQFVVDQVRVAPGECSRFVCRHFWQNISSVRLLHTGG